MTHYKQFSFKKIGYTNLLQCRGNQIMEQGERFFLKIVFVKAGGHVVIDFQEYHLEEDAFFFISIGQHYWFNEYCNGTLLYYNKDFYCVEIHDKEVACDGILFHNVYQVPVVFMNTEVSAMMQNILQQIKDEMEEDEIAIEEMLRTLLKQIIIKCTRIWKKNNQLDAEELRPKVEFSRTFSQLVERHYIKYHSVAQYAELLHITPKALNKRITGTPTPPLTILLKIALSLKQKGY